MIIGPGFDSRFYHGDFSHGDHGLGSLVKLRFKDPPGTSYSYITIHLIGTTTAPHGRPNFRWRLHIGHNQEGRPRSPLELESKSCFNQQNALILTQ
jgi:hypothetical protein